LRQFENNLTHLDHTMIWNLLFFSNQLTRTIPAGNLVFE
jgi:hypothetical protein